MLKVILEVPKVLAKNPSGAGDFKVYISRQILSLEQVKAVAVCAFASGACRTLGKRAGSKFRVAIFTDSKICDFVFNGVKIDFKELKTPLEVLKNLSDFRSIFSPRFAGGFINAMARSAEATNANALAKSANQSNYKEIVSQLSNMRFIGCDELVGE